MGEVWEATDGGELRLALKIARKGSGEYLRRLLEEGRATAGLSHPNLLPVTDVVPVPGGAALVMPLVAGPSLDLLLRTQPLSPDEALALFVQIVAGVEHAHRAGLVHRDLKPGNVLLDPQPDGVVARVADFGLVKQLAREQALTAAGVALGTPAYAAPEQLRDAATADHRVDLWALGVIFVELLTGRRPFAGRSPVELAEAQARGPELRGVPDAHLPLVRALLALDPAQRPSGADVVRQALEAQVNPRVLQADGPLYRLLRAGPEAASGPPPTPSFHMPAAPDSFIGRAAELRELASALAAHPLVTLHGPGGTGKTRLAPHYAHSRPSAHPEGAWFCDLSEARDLDAVLGAVARALDIPLVAGAALTQIGHAIASRGRCLIVLDNAEQVTGPLAEAAAAWTARAPQARLLVTSRRPLGLPDEQVIAVAPLDPGEAERLFWARAREARPDVATTPGELEAGRALVELLDGLPLAIELAAARARMLPVSGILARMKERFRLLAGGAERAPRQATLRATLDWSWNLLAAEEQAVLAQLAVFEGGVPTAALDEVLLSDRPASAVVAALVERSLVRRQSPDRLHLLMSVAAYAAERLTERGERAATELRHGAWFARLGEADALRRLEGPGGPARRRSLIAELDNLQAASRRAAARGDGPIAARSALAAAEGIQMAGASPTAVALLRAALATPGIDRSTTAALRIAAGQALRLGGQLDAAEAELESARADAEDRQNHWQLAEALLALGTLRRERGRAEPARAALQAAVAEAELAAPLQDTEDLRLAAIYQLAIMDRQRGEFAAARAALQDALARSRAASLALQECRLWSELGVLAAEQDRPDEALAHHEASLALARRLGSRADEASRLGLMGTAHMLAGRLDLAATHSEAALAAMRRTGQRRREGISILNLANIYAQSQRRADARRLYGEALAIARELENRVTEGVILSNLGSLLGEECRYGEAEAHLRQALAVQEAIGDRRNGAITRLSLGQVHRELGRMCEAREALEAARESLRAAGVGVFEALATAELGVLAGELGELEEAEALLREAWEQMVARGNARHGDGVRVRLGLALLADGKPEEARIELEEALVQVRRPHGWQELPRCLSGLARLTAAAGDPGWRSLLDEAVARSGSMPRVLAELRAIRAELLLAAGELEAARAEVEAAREGAQPGSIGACILALAARIVWAQGDTVQAQILHGQAEAAYEELGAGPRSPLGRQLAALNQQSR